MNIDETTLIKPCALGYWKSEHEPDLPHPEQFVDTRISDTERNALINYLLRGKLFISYFGFSYCRFNCGIAVDKMGAQSFTDGKYVWPEGLVHYIKEHHVWLPEPFISHSKSNIQFDPASVDLKRMHYLLDYGWWKSTIR